MQQLKIGSSLQGGKYKIEKVLGQGGFGITYLATQELLDRKVCIKEFFFKEYCERDEATSHVSLGTQSNHELVERFMIKFLKEARTISQLEHPHIIRIHDIFKENNTAYYVMEYIEGESLADRVNQFGCLPESEAVEYIKQVASALDFIHQRSINHLDVKPANIMIRKTDNKAVLIDFGLSKQYDAQGGQTSTTPVGISHGYAPMEQYNVGGVSTFSPQSDIYSLGATLYKLVTGNTPPQASDVLNDGLPELPDKISSQIKGVIVKAMQPKKVERFCSIKEFVGELERKKVADVVETLHENEETVLLHEVEEVKHLDSEVPLKTKAKSKGRSVLWSVFVVFIVLVVGIPQMCSRYKEAEKVKKEAIAKEMEQQRINDSIAVVRKKEAEKRKKDSIDAVNEQARLAALRKKEEEKWRMTHGTINGHDYVDLGLSVKWATCNVGASKPSDYGDYFAWGEIKPKSEYIERNYSLYGKELPDISGNFQYDAARANWGGSWRMPTRRECEELVNKCKFEFVVLNNCKGYKCIGPNGNSIFFPAAGCRLVTTHDFGEEFYCWSSTPYKGITTTFRAYLIYDYIARDNRPTYAVNCGERRSGRSVRPVSD